MMKATREMSRAPSRLMRWQWGTVALMVAGYAGYYLCRSNLSVCIPLIRDDLLRQGCDPDTAKQRLGLVVSFARERCHPRSFRVPRLRGRSDPMRLMTP